MLYTEHKEAMMCLLEKHNAISEIIKNKNVHYLDIPIHGNIGDLLIMHGTLRFLNRKQVVISTVASALDYSFKNIPREDVILLHGGGNFGDLYALHQDFREAIIKEYPDNVIIILPQTIYFKSDVSYKHCCTTLSNHNNLHICVRDNGSYELAKKMTDHIYLMPDMAHNLYPLNASSEPSKKLLAIKRADLEKGVFDIDTKADRTTDWGTLIKNSNKLIALYSKALKLSGNLKTNWLSKLLITSWLSYSKRLTMKALNLFSEYEEVVSNRLHAHILACLMDKKNTILDNSYGKNSAYISCWTKNSDLVTLKVVNKNEK